jgi:hypothetical protein
MWRSVSFLGLAAAFVCAVASSLRSADKREAPGETQARDLVKQALVAESQGDNDQRSKYLKEAWLSVPDLAEANWHMARIRVGEQWQPLAEAVTAATNSSDEATYRQLRDKANSARQLRELARWCDKHGWNDRARLHYAQLLANSKADDSYKSEAVEKLDLVQVNGVWLTKEEVASRQEQAKAIQDSLARWRPKLKKLQTAIDGDDFAPRDKAIVALHAIDDPTAIPALESFLLDGRERFTEEAVKRLASFDEYEATLALVRYAVLSDFLLTRSAATDALKQRPLHEFVPSLLAGLISPFKSQYQLRWDAEGRVQYVHAILQEGPSANLLLVTHQLSRPTVVHTRSGKETGRVVRRFPRFNPNQVSDYKAEGSIKSLPTSGFQDERAQIASQAANAEAQVRLANSQARANNGRIFEVLEEVTGEQLSREPARWWSWWQSHNEYSTNKPTKYAYRWKNSYYASQFVHTHRESSGTLYLSCFLAGTPVRTERGAVPIESIQPGDRVLAQDQDTGELTYKVVLKTTLRPPAKMLRVSTGGDQVVTTLGHPFWVSGHGWKMAKELKAGDLLHTLGGAVKIESVRPADEERAHNLVVDDFNTYFVGQAGSLVHDNEFRKPTQATVPGLVQ